MTTGGTATATSAAASRRDRWFAIAFAVVGVSLVPWIVALASTQAHAGTSGDLVATSSGILVALAATLVASAVTCSRNSPYVTVAVTASGVLATTTAFFHVVTGTAVSVSGAVVSVVLVFLPIAVLAAWVVVRLAPLPPPTTVPRWVSIAFGLFAVVMVPLVLRVVTSSPESHAATHLVLTWTALDVAELIAILSTAVALWRGSAAVAGTATATAALLVSDVWFNVVATTGETRTSGVLMSAISLPLAAVSLGIAVRASRPSVRRGPR